ncbi:MAG: glycosyltransferase, partial [Candidatus Methanoperedens sp.]|nr:glycosyltransferase [Candidatus Methanoperedens sp.]
MKNILFNQSIMKFSIITPAYNMEKWIKETIESVLSQAGDFEIEYIIIDGGSKDRTYAIAQQYESLIHARAYPVQCKRATMRCMTQINTGMYEAINQGFDKATGDICAWINADDLYEPGAFDAIARTYRAFPNIQWLKGITSTIDENGKKIRRGACKIYHQDWIAQGIYGQEAYFIEQDSVFWRTDMWKKAGPMPAHFQSAADYWLWIQFAKYAPLWPLNIPVSCFRKRENQISKDIAKYKHEQSEIRPHREWSAWNTRLFFSPQS